MLNFLLQTVLVSSLEVHNTVLHSFFYSLRWASCIPLCISKCVPWPSSCHEPKFSQIQDPEADSTRMSANYIQSLFLVNRENKSTLGKIKAKLRPEVTGANKKVSAERSRDQDHGKLQQKRKQLLNCEEAMVRNKTELWCWRLTVWARLRSLEGGRVNVSKRI